MKHIQVLGTGCSNCRLTEARIRKRAQVLGVQVRIEKIENIIEIMGFSVMATPGVVVDGEVMHTGGVPKEGAIDGWLQ